MKYQGPPKKSMIRFFRPRNYLYKMNWVIKVVQVRHYSKITSKSLSISHKRGLFIDCGSNVGQGFQFFSRYYKLENFDYILFEPNPNCFRILEKNLKNFGHGRIELREKAVGVFDSKVDFYGISDLQGGQLSVGGTTLQAHNSKYFAQPTKSDLQVESISFSKLLLKVSDQYDCIIVKLDIEGGEYPILEDLREKKLLGKIETLFIEFHSQYMSENEAVKYREIEQQFWKHVKTTDCRAISWI
jgi:FkbM family methyltransferase